MKLKTILFCLLLAANIHSQTSTEEWTHLAKLGGDNIYIDIAGLENFKGNDIYIWTMTEHDPPLVIESVKKKIYSSKTYYLLNKKLMKYSMLQVIYYDGYKNVLTSFDYSRSSEIDLYRYNYPILEGSEQELILMKSIEVISKFKTSK